MSLRDINAALVSAYQSIGLGLPTSYEGRSFTAPSGQPWARVQNFPAKKFVHSLGVNGDDKVTGFFQIDLFVPKDDGTGRLLGFVDSVLSHFENGRRFSYNGREVRITNSSLSPIRKDPSTADNYFNISVYWESTVQR